MIFCSRCDSWLDHWPFAHLHPAESFVICAGSASYNNRERENKNIEQRKLPSFLTI